MCIIVDANAASQLSNKTDDGKPVLTWLLQGSGGLILGGDLKRELARAGFGPVLVTLNRAGRLKQLDDVEVNDASDRLRAKNLCKSNDHHILAAAIVSGCRLIFSADKALHQDAKNTDILKPGAAIYQTQKHKHLLKKCTC